MKFFLPIFFILFIYINAEGQNTFQKTYGGEASSYITSIQEDIDGSLILSGFTQIFLKNFIIRTDSNGDTTWMKTYVDSVVLPGSYVDNTRDHGYVVAVNRGTSGPYIFKTDSNGNVLWAREIAVGSVEVYVETILALPDSNILISGEFLNMNSMSQDIFLMKLNLNGDTIWTRAFGGSYDDYSRSIDITSDGGFIIGGSTLSFTTSLESFYLIRTDSGGNILWSKKYENSNEYVRCFSVKQTFDGGFILTGPQGGILKVDSLGNFLWNYKYSFNDFYSFDISLSSDSGFIITGWGLDTLANEGIFIFKIDSNGNPQWGKIFDCNDDGVAAHVRISVIQLSDNGYVTGGWRTNNGLDSTGSYLIKTDKFGNSNCNQHNILLTMDPESLQENSVTTLLYSGTFFINPVTITTGHLDSVLTLCSSITEIQNVNDRMPGFLISPNPSQGQFSINNLKKNINKIWIYNLFGQNVFESSFNQNQESLAINCQNLSPGIYFVKAIFDSGTVIKKIVIE
jgi:hypothetical protein